VHVQPLNSAIGARITGIDLRELDDTTFAALQDALTEHLVVFLPGQALTDPDQLGLIRRFGGDYVHPLARAAGIAESTVGHIVDDADHPPFQDQWHTDVSWDPNPPTWGILRAIEIPPRGGDTMWASMYAAYDALSPVMQRAIGPLEATHTMGSATSFISKAGADAVARAREQFPGAVHPVVGMHPDTGRRYLNVNREFTDSIVGMTPDESRAVLDFLTSHAANPNFQLRYSWRVGDVAMWDERCTQHFAVADYMPERREMGRVAVVVPSA